MDHASEHIDDALGQTVAMESQGEEVNSMLVGAEEGKQTLSKEERGMVQSSSERAFNQARQVVADGLCMQLAPAAALQVALHRDRVAVVCRPGTHIWGKIKQSQVRILLSSLLFFFLLVYTELKSEVIPVTFSHVIRTVDHQRRLLLLLLLLLLGLGQDVTVRPVHARRRKAAGPLLSFRQAPRRSFPAV